MFFALHSEQLRERKKTKKRHTLESRYFIKSHTLDQLVSCVIIASIEIVVVARSTTLEYKHTGKSHKDKKKSKVEKLSVLFFHYNSHSSEKGLKDQQLRHKLIRQLVVVLLYQKKMNTMNSM